MCSQCYRQLHTCTVHLVRVQCVASVTDSYIPVQFTLYRQLHTCTVYLVSVQCVASVTDSYIPVQFTLYRQLHTCTVHLVQTVTYLYSSPC